MSVLVGKKKSICKVVPVTGEGKKAKSGKSDIFSIKRVSINVYGCSQSYICQKCWVLFEKAKQEERRKKEKSRGRGRGIERERERLNDEEVLLCLHFPIC